MVPSVLSPQADSKPALTAAKADPAGFPPESSVPPSLVAGGEVRPPDRKLSRLHSGSWVTILRAELGYLLLSRWA